jgi:hypothetical protein
MYEVKFYRDQNGKSEIVEYFRCKKSTERGQS